MAKHSLIPQDYEGLLDEYKYQKAELESVRQQLYDSARQLKINESLLVEYQSEIEHLRASESAEKKKYETKILALEEAIKNSREGYSQKEGLFDTELTKKEVEISNLKSELELFKKTNTEMTQLDITNSQFEDLQFLKDENDMLKESYNELKENMEVIEQQRRELEQTVDQYKDEINQLRQTLDFKREELSEQAEVIDKLTEELAGVKNELATFKQKPLDQESKGNSLFAEVNDRRVHLEQKYNSMKIDCVRMKQEFTQHQKIVSSLRKQNAELCDKWKKDVEEIEEDRLLIKKSFKERIYTLEQLVEKLHKDLEVKPHNVTDDLCAEYTFYTNMISSREAEIRELERKINRNSLYETGMSIELAQAHKEMRKWHNEAIKLAQEKDFQKASFVPRVSDHFKAPAPVRIDRTPPLRSCIKTNSESIRKVLQETNTSLEEEDLENITENTNLEETEMSTLDIEDKENFGKREVKFCDSSLDEPKVSKRRPGPARVFDLRTSVEMAAVKKCD